MSQAIRVPDIVQCYVDRLERPVRVQDVREALEALSLGSFNKAAVRNKLHDGSRASTPRHTRLAWEPYAMSATRR